MLTPDLLFDLSQFPFPQLFDAKQPAWHALCQLEEFFKSLSLGKILGEIEPGVHMVHPELISIGPGTRVESGAYLVGPCWIGSNCQIRHGAYLRGHVLACDRAVIGHATEAKHAIFMHKAQAGHFAYVGNSILGNFVNLGAGTKCANLRFDHQMVRIQGQQTGLKKMGAILGDHAQTGCNVVTNPGTILMPHAFAPPCSSVKGIVVSQVARL